MVINCHGIPNAGKDIVHIPIVKKLMLALTSISTGEQDHGSSAEEDRDVGGKTIEERLYEIRAEFRNSLQTATINTKQNPFAQKRENSQKQSAKTSIHERRRRLLLIGIGCATLLSTVTVWFAFGLYGM